jgi:4-hydroxybenzoate polyprenyltransferase
MKNLFSWFKERFPAINFISAFVMYGMVSSVARHMIGEPGAHFKIQDFFGALALALYFLILRISDEHKDFDLDMKNYPQRVLQSGRVTLPQLKKLGWLAGAYCLLTSLVLDSTRSSGVGIVSLFFAIVILMAFLMNKEFFIKTWLKDHLLVYGVVHLLSAPLTALWIIAMSAPSAISSEHALGVSQLIALPFFAGMVYELVRKSFGAEEEKTDLESYSRIFGSGRIAMVTSIFVLATLFLELTLLANVNGPYAQRFQWIPLVGCVGALYGLAVYFKKPQHKTRKLSEATSGSFILINYILLMVFALG